MKNFILTSLAVTAALITVLSTRLIIPAAIILFRAIEQSFEPEDPTVSPSVKSLPASNTVVVTAAPVEATPVKPAPKRRRTRKPAAPVVALA